MYHQLPPLMVLVFISSKLIHTQPTLSHPFLLKSFKHFFLVASLTLFYPTASFAQKESVTESFHNTVNQRVIDVLSKKIAQAENDSIKTTYLMKLATIYIYRNPDSTVNIARRGLQVLKDNKAKWVPDIEIQLRSYLGHAHRLKGNFNAATIAFQEMLNRTTTWQDSSLMVVS
ncbi:MAG: hypothetical protein JKY03_03785 [Aureispira sp.]|nr:hypothetical protein [Aureispira sp.]